MKINNKKQMIITSIVCVLPMIIGAIIYSKLPKQMPIHFNYSGNADNYAPKAFVCFALPLIMLLANLLLHVIINNDPKNNGGGSVVATISKWTIPVVSVIVFALCSIYGLGYNLSSTKYVIVAVGILIIFIGNYLPKCRQNYTVGIKLPWTLNDINNWNKNTQNGRSFVDNMWNTLCSKCIFRKSGRSVNYNINYCYGLCAYSLFVFTI